MKKVKLKNTIERLCDNLVRLNEEQVRIIKENYLGKVKEYFPEEAIAIFDDSDISKSCNMVRNLLKINLNDQKKINDISKSLEMWRDSFEKIGISVFKDSFQNNAYSGFCIYDDKFPIIFINNNLSKTRQLFTLFHELSHILFQTSGIDIENDDSINEGISNIKDKKIEQFCNKFASEFLVPNSDFINQYYQLKTTNSDIEFICQKLSKLYTVSKEVILRKIIDNHFYSPDIYQILVDKWNNELNNIPKRKQMGNFYNNKITYLGKNYVSIVFKEYFSHSISLSQASNFLMIKPKSFSEFSKRFRGGM